MPRRNPGQAVPIPWAPGFSVWRGTPTRDEIYGAPPFTVFVGKKAKGELSLASIDLLGGEDALFIGERDDIPYDDDVARILQSSGLPWGSKTPPADPHAALQGFPDAADDLLGEEVEIEAGRRFVLQAEDAAVWALEAGYSLLVVPDALKGKNAKYRMLYVIDDEGSDGNRYWWTQTPLHAELAALAAGAAPSTSADLDFINAHRKKIGMKPLDPAKAGWSDDDVRIEAQRLRGNPEGDEDEPQEPLLVKHTRSTGNYHMEIWEEDRGDADDPDVWGVIEVHYTGQWGGGEPARLQYDLSEEGECEMFDEHRALRGDFDVEQALLHFDYDMYCAPRRREHRSPRDENLEW